MIVLRQFVGKAGESATDRLAERMGGDVSRHVAQDALDALTPLEVLGAQVRQFLPDTDVVGCRSCQGGLIQHVKGHIGELVHGPILRPLVIDHVRIQGSTCG